MLVGGVRWRDQGHGSKAVDRGHRSVPFLGRSAPGKGTPQAGFRRGVYRGRFYIYICVGCHGSRIVAFPEALRGGRGLVAEP